MTNSFFVRFLVLSCAWFSFSVCRLLALSVSFHGGAGQVGGSSALVTGGGVSVLIDCGTAYSDEAGERSGIDERDFTFPVTNLTAVLLTHAHQDHAGRVPELVRAGFKGPLVMTEPSRELLRSAWRSQLRYDASFGKAPGWTKRRQDLMDELMARVKIVSFGETNTFGRLSVVFSPVKHLPGAASIRLQDEEGSCLFSGDLGTLRSKLVKKIEPGETADAVFVETTYGASSLGSPEEIEAEYTRFRTSVAETVRSGGLAWIPAFAMDRTQRVLLEIQQAIDEGRIPATTPLYLLSPTARTMTEAYVSHPEWFDVPSMSRLDALVKRSRRFFDPSRGWGPEGAILVTTSGMMDAAASAALLPDLASKPNVKVLLVGYQAPGTSGRELAHGARELKLKRGKMTVDVGVLCKTEKYSCFSGHGDARENDRWLANNLTSRIYLVHGDKASLAARKDDLEKRLGVGVSIAEKGTVYEITKSVPSDR